MEGEHTSSGDIALDPSEGIDPVEANRTDCDAYTFKDG
jgi:hypothetical protein